MVSADPETHFGSRHAVAKPIVDGSEVCVDGHPTARGINLSYIQVRSESGGVPPGVRRRKHAAGKDGRDFCERTEQGTACAEYAGIEGHPSDCK
jgi:hypothetical protein